MPRRFIILTTQRSGSTFLRLWLDSHPEIRAHSEVFLRRNDCDDDFCAYLARSPFGRFYLRKAQGRKPFSGWAERFLVERFLNELCSDRPPAMPTRPVDADGATRWIAQEASHVAHSAIGFNLMHNQYIAFPPLQGWLWKNQVSVIHLVRRNLLDPIVSRELATITKQYHSTVIPNCHDQVTVYLKPEATRTEIANTICAHRQFSDVFRNSHPYMPVNYEELTGQQGSMVYHQILDFLEADTAASVPPPPLRKVNTLPHHERVANYDEVIAALAEADVPLQFENSLPDPALPQP